jgi:hypothetical protein
MFLNTQQGWLSKCSCIHVVCVCLCLSVYLAFDGLLKVKSSRSSIKNVKNAVPQQEFYSHINGITGILEVNNLYKIHVQC